jgi:hypothetical protein
MSDGGNLNFETKHLSKLHFIKRIPHGLPWDWKGIFTVKRQQVIARGKKNIMRYSVLELWIGRRKKAGGRGDLEGDFGDCLEATYSLN